MEKNRKFWLTKYIFNKNYLSQIQEIFCQFKHTAQLNYADAKLLTIQPMCFD